MIHQRKSADGFDARDLEIVQDDDDSDSDSNADPVDVAQTSNIDVPDP